MNDKPAQVNTIIQNAVYTAWKKKVESMGIITSPGINSNIRKLNQKILTKVFDLYMTNTKVDIDKMINEMIFDLLKIGE